MIKNVQWILTAILTCCLCITSCTEKDNPAGGSVTEPNYTYNLRLLNTKGTVLLTVERGLSPEGVSVTSSAGWLKAESAGIKEFAEQETSELKWLLGGKHFLVRLTFDAFDDMAGSDERNAEVRIVTKNDVILVKVRQSNTYKDIDPIYNQIKIDEGDLIILAGGKGDDSGKNTLSEVTTDYDKMIDWFWTVIKIANPHVQTAWNADVNPADFNMLLVNQEKTRMYLLNPTNKKEIPQSEWSEDVKRAVQNTSSFSHVVFNGLNSTIILFKVDEFEEEKEMRMSRFGVDFTLKEFMFGMVSLFYHESFHKYVQIPVKGWQKPDQGENASKENRDQSYPIDYMPRVYRKMAMLALKAAWDNPSQKDKHYSRAKYWTDKYEKTYPQEAAGIKLADINEGTADFFERSLLHPLFGLKQLHEIEGLYLGSDVEVESYMSSIAVWLAKRDGRMAEAIANFKQNALTPISFLLKDVPVPVNYDESQDAAEMEVVRKTLSKIYGEDNENIQLVMKAVDAHKTGTLTYLSVPQPEGSGGDAGEGFSLKEFPGYSCTTKVTCSTEDYAMSKLTVLGYAAYFLIPTTNAGNLTVTGLKNVEASSPIEPVTVTQEGQLTAVTGIEGFTMKKLPIDVYIGKDSYGNTYYMIKEQPKIF